PTNTYLKASTYPTIQLPLPLIKKQLLVLDLNGTLISRIKRPNGGFYLRPHHSTFFDYIFSNFVVMIWSSAQKHSVEAMCKVIDYPLQLVWDRSHFGLSTAEFYSKIDTIKDLDKVWEVLPEFNAANTIVLDDTPFKLVKQPYNLIKVSTFQHGDKCDHELFHVIDYLKTIQLQSNVTNFVKNNPY
ncbi:HAD-like domain-containing protein, partial [Cokeromyces recurvatus]|uniref:HAD-like domain-containing protein n=1 Tax=Cokeromyces recurvatus TaxID=90255 RepID=UPI00221FEAFA